MDKEKPGPDDWMAAVLLAQRPGRPKRRKARNHAATDVEAEDDAVQLVSMKLVGDGGRDRRRGATSLVSEESTGCMHMVGGQACPTHSALAANVVHRFSPEA